MSNKSVKKPTGADAPTPWPEQLGQASQPTPSYSATVLDRALNSVRDLNQHLQELQVVCGIKVNVDGVSKHFYEHTTGQCIQTVNQVTVELVAGPDTDNRN